MKGRPMPFDHRPDPALGAALGQALSAEDHSTFVARVTAALAVPAVPRAAHWDILASWARPGIAVACVVALGAGLMVRAMQPPVDLVASVAAPSARDLIASVGPPHPAVVLAPAEVR
jgi:hypothetical protein